MALSNHLISQFVKVTDDTDKSKKEKSTYGTIKEYNGEKYVQIDGSNMLTPYFSTAIVKDGDRVVVDLKDHNAVISGNITSPATRSDDFNAEVTNTAENFKATNASIDTLKVKQGQFEELATEKLNAAEANIDTLTTRVGEFESATAENFTATNASIENLSGDFANFKVTTTDSLTANEANITKVIGDLADFITVTTDTFKSTDAEITNLKTAKADIDLANIDVANIGILFNKVGLIDRATIVDGHITGFLDAVEINADSITAGTLIADRILLTGSQNGLLYQLNNLGELTSANVDTLDGSILTERTVTADKLVAKSITTNELDVNNIFGNSAVLSTLVSQEAFINAISSNTVVVGASEDAKDALSKATAADTNAENALTKANQSIKGITYHYLATSAPSGVTTSTSGWTTTAQAMTSTNKYLWTYQTMADASGNTSNTTPVISGVYGDKGLQGDKGDTGATGPQGIQGEKGDTGAQGPKGDTGATGTSITQAIPLYYASNSTTAPSAPTSAVTSTSTGTKVWTTVQPAFNKSYPYIYTCTQVKYSTNTYTWSAVTIDRTLSNMAQWCSSSDVTLIDGSKIYTGSITAQQIASGAITTDKLGANAVTAEKLSVSNLNAIAAKIGNFSLDTRLYATATGYINPTTADYKVMKNAFAEGTLSSLYNENAYWDLDGDGDVDLLDYAYVKNMMWRNTYNYKDMAHKKTSAINLEINPSDPYKMIKMSGTNAWGTHVEAYYGLNGMKTPKVVSDGADIGDGGVHCSDDVIAGWGTDNQVSLQTLNSKLGKFVFGRISMSIPARKAPYTTQSISSLGLGWTPTRTNTIILLSISDKTATSYSGGNSVDLFTFIQWYSDTNGYIIAYTNKSSKAHTFYVDYLAIHTS